MKILITGATGFIGRSLTRSLVDGGKEIFGIVRRAEDLSILRDLGAKGYNDSGNDVDMLSFFSDTKFDGVVHLATHYVSEHTTEDIRKLVESNILYPTRVLEAASLSGVKWFVNTGTFAQNLGNDSYNPLNLYAASKQAFEVMSKHYSEMNFVTLKLNATYGPGDNRDKIFNAWSRATVSEEVLDMSPGDQSLDMVYIDDVVSAFESMIELMDGDRQRRFDRRCFSILSGKAVTLRDMASIFSKVSGKPLRIRWGAKPYRKRESMQSFEGYESVPGWAGVVSLEDGIRKIINIKGDTA